MSKMGNWVLEMQENAADMTREQFTNMFGNSNVHIWEEINGEEYGSSDARETSESRSVQRIDSGYDDEIPF